MGINLGANGTETVDERNQMFTASEMWGLHARFEAGFQLVSTAGFTTELGLSMMMFETDEGKTAQQLWPVIHLGWLW
jgi:hypothetical protein